MTKHMRNTSRLRMRAMMAGCTALIAVPSLAFAQAEQTPVVLDEIKVQAEDDAQTLVANEVTSGSGLATDVLDTAATVSRGHVPGNPTARGTEH